jgi:hypothetical protein
MTQHFLAQQHRIHCKTVSSLQAQVDEKSPVVPGLVLVEHEQEVVDTNACTIAVSAATISSGDGPNNAEPIDPSSEEDATTNTGSNNAEPIGPSSEEGALTTTGALTVAVTVSAGTKTSGGGSISAEHIFSLGEEVYISSSTCGTINADAPANGRWEVLVVAAAGIEKCFYAEGEIQSLKLKRSAHTNVAASQLKCDAEPAPAQSGGIQGKCVS